MGDNGDDGRGGGGGLGVKCDERHKQRRWWSGDRAWLGACRQLWVPSLYLNPLGTEGISGGGGSLAGVGGFGAGAAELGIGGFGGGEGGSSGLYVGGGGGCGVGPGGAVFVMQGGSLTLAGPLTVEGNAVSPGQGGPTAGDWQTFGSGFFLRGNGTLGFAPGAGQPHTVSDVIADQSGNDRSVADGTDGSWSLLKKSGWALVLGNSGTALPGRCGRRRHAEHCRRWRSRQRHAGARRSINRRVDGRR